VTAAAAVATMLLLAPLIAPMPQAALAAVVIAYSIDLVQPKDFRAIRRVRRVEFRWTVIACAGVILLGTLKGILVAVIASMVSLVYQACNPPVYALGRRRGSNVFRALSPEHADDETWPGLLLVRTEGRIFFANAQRVGEAVSRLVEQTLPSVVVLDCSAVLDIEYTALKMLVDLERKLRDEGVTLCLAALNAEALTVLERSHLRQDLGSGRLFFNLETAVEAYEARATPPAGESSA
jgi:MFS superfamily sulfate permease-like transporter